VLAAVTLAQSAHAQASGDAAPTRRDPIAAEALFTRGKQLIEQGQTTQACAAFQESQRLDPAGGTLLRLALCHEADGKLASAWLEFTEVVRLSQSGDAAKLAERVKIAHEHLAAIEPRVSKLVVTVDAASRVDGLTVTANGLPRNEGTWGVAIPVDPGDVTIEASAPGRLPYRSVVRVEDGKQIAVDIPALDVAPASATPAAPGPSSVEPSSAGHGSSVRPVAIVVGAIGVVTVAIGSYFGVTAISKWNDSNANCPGSTGCNSTGAQDAHDAKQAAGLADVTIGVGAAAIAAGVILYLVGAPKNVQAKLDGVAVTF
jgi:hypothetical protein